MIVSSLTLIQNKVANPIRNVCRNVIGQEGQKSLNNPRFNLNLAQDEQLSVALQSHYAGPYLLHKKVLD